MTDSGKTTFTPGQPVTIIDAKGVRGPGSVTGVLPNGVVTVSVDFDHWADMADGGYSEAGETWNFEPHGHAPFTSLQILPEPFTEPKGEEDEIDRMVEGAKAHAKLLGGTFVPDQERIAAFRAHQSSKGDSDKPLTVESDGPGPLERLGDQEWQALLDKDDRTSPEEYPEMVLITRAELGGAMCEAYLLAKDQARSSLGTVPAAMDLRPHLRMAVAAMSEMAQLIHDEGLPEHRDSHELEALTRAKVACEEALSSAPDALPTTGAGQELVEAARSMDTAPKDGTMLRLLVDYSADDADHALEDELQAWTIGFNNLANTDVDEWRFAGWCWCHDHFVQGRGKPIGWLPWDNPEADRTAIANTQVAGPEKATLRRAKDRVIEQACEAVAAGPGEHERLRHAVLEYYRVCGDDAMADALEAQQ